MPARAEDAAIVPVTMRVTLPPGDPRRLKALTLVIDDNPVPVAATFTFGDDAGVSAISTRVRVNSYTDVHVVAELSDGKLYVVKTYVKASGGCSAPAAKNADEAIASLGRMKLRVFGRPTGGPTSAPREAQIMIRHPNNSGLQRDQVSLLYIPANFVDELRVWQGDALLFTHASRDFDIGRSELPLHLHSQRCHDVQSRGPRHRGQSVPAASGRRAHRRCNRGYLVPRLLVASAVPRRARRTDAISPGPTLSGRARSAACDPSPTLSTAVK